MTTNEILEEISSYSYKSFGFGVFGIDYVCFMGYWGASWRNPAEFSNPDIQEPTPHKACVKALEFVKAHPEWFKKKSKKA
jgi:hypothetical protein